MGGHVVRRAVGFAVLAISLAACQEPNIGAETAALTPAADSLGQRQIQMRRFDTSDETKLLSASAGVLQDLGFNIDDGSATTGFLVASKDRDAIEAGQVAGQLFLVALAAAVGAKSDAVYDKNQKIRILMVVKPVATGNATTVRVTFQRAVWNNKNQIAHVDTINDPTIYQQFFDKLSQSVFLEAHAI
jgi:hypothetical protein